MSCASFKVNIENPNLKNRLDKVLGENLNHKTRDFLESLKAYYDKNKTLSERQVLAFKRIETSFSPAQKDIFEKWTLEYKEEYIQDAKIVAKYYVRTGYYTKIANSILDDDSYIPNRKDFLKLINNPYAQKVLIATRSAPLFADNDLIQLRSTVGKSWAERELSKFKLRKCFVLKNDLPVVNAVKGGKRYEILPMGSPNPLEIDERYLMKPNKRGKNS